MFNIFYLSDLTDTAKVHRDPWPRLQRKRPCSGLARGFTSFYSDSDRSSLIFPFVLQFHTRLASSFQRRMTSCCFCLSSLGGDRPLLGCHKAAAQSHTGTQSKTQIWIFLVSRFVRLIKSACNKQTDRWISDLFHWSRFFSSPPPKLNWVPAWAADSTGIPVLCHSTLPCCSHTHWSSNLSPPLWARTLRHIPL